MHIALEMDARDKQQRHQDEQRRSYTAHLAQFVIAPCIALTFCLIELADRFYHSSNRLACHDGKVTPQAANPVPFL